MVYGAEGLVGWLLLWDKSIAAAPMPPAAAAVPKRMYGVRDLFEDGCCDGGASPSKTIGESCAVFTSCILPRVSMVTDWPTRRFTDSVP